MTPAELARFVRKVEIKSSRLTTQVFTGEYHAAFRGRGMSFAEVRDYQPGDDVRDIDWNVTARTGEPHIKVFEEERELTVLVLVDVSASMLFGTREQSKARLATELTAVLGHAALKNNDKIGALLYGHERLQFIPPQKGFRHLLHIVRELAVVEPSRGSADLAQALRFVNDVVRRRAVVFVVSDFVDQGDGFRTPLNVTARRHDLVGLRMTDTFEQTPPSAGLVVLRDLETGAKRLVDSASPAFRTAFAERQQTQREEMEQLFHRASAQLLSLRTGEDYVPALMQFFHARQRRR